jgi:putative FmdB family regulatory protein
MPFYEYQCSRCGHHHEELQKITDKPLRKCPECGRLTLTRLVSAPVFRLKGGGWYETDFKSDKEGKRNLAGDKEPPVKTDSSGKAAGADAKTAEAAPAKADAPAKAPAAEKKPAKVKPKAGKPTRTSSKRR